MTLRTMIRLALLAMLACAIAPPPALADGEVEGYTVDGTTMSVESGRIYAAGTANLRSGIAALERQDYRTAQRECRAAYDKYTSIDLHGMGATGSLRQQWDGLKGCIADSYLGLGDRQTACDWYKVAHWTSLRFENPGEICNELRASQDKASRDWGNYARSFAGFSDIATRLNAMPGGSERTAFALERLNPACGELAGYQQTVTGAVGAAAYCEGMVLFEQGQSNAGCQAFWMGAGHLAKMAGNGTSPQNETHIGQMRAQLESFRATCAQQGFAWPAYGTAWPRSSTGAAAGPGSAGYLAAYDAYRSARRQFDAAPSGETGTALKLQCQAINGFAEQGPPIPAAASLCYGYVFFRTGRPETGCKYMWMANRYFTEHPQGETPAALQGNRAAILGELPAAKALCQSAGYAWTDPARPWPYPDAD
ncbi:MAG: hypothetical protein IE933_13700 [Sphingomonadales bacterium]|nr:hypothetical protein [Sphingomonadales bacterium]MBD3775122.1 hypothetical protein [Paracoccaceae bacterium]